jgi:hypothetical protein
LSRTFSPVIVDARHWAEREAVDADAEEEVEE